VQMIGGNRACGRIGGAMKVDDQLRRLGELRRADVSAEMIEEVRKGLKSASGFVVAKAADVVREKRLDALRGEMVEAFERCLAGGEKKDKGCEGKLAIVKAMHELEWEEIDLFRKGVKCVQMEPTWGGSMDAGANVRAASAVALARTRYPRVLMELVKLLVDPEPRVRIAAAEAVGAAGRSEGEMVLRLKVMMSTRVDPLRARMIEPEPEVITACLSSILQLGRSSSVKFVAEYLDSPDEPVRDGAALALGASRVVEAFEALKSKWSAGMDQSFMETILLAMGTMRDERATAFLLEQVEQGSTRIAKAALAAATDERAQKRLVEAMAKRDDLK
jgi:HEAT repeat protein